MKAIEDLLRNINEAFADNNRDFILSHVTDDIIWTVVGYKDVIQGKDEFEKALKEMEGPTEMDLKITNMVIQQDMAAVDGRIVLRKEEGKKKKYAFCDIYRLRGENQPKISEMISYVIDVSKQKKP